jgi:rhodanese-related sulfurtransferase
MRRRLGLLALLVLAVACEAGWLHERGLRVIREVDVGEGDRLLEDPDAILLQVRGPGWKGPRLAGTEVLDASAPLPPGLADSRTVVVLAEDLGEGLRMAARLSRAGIQGVAVVKGGVAAWQAAHAGSGGSAPIGRGARTGGAEGAGPPPQHGTQSEGEDSRWPT